MSVSAARPAATASVTASSSTPAMRPCSLPHRGRYVPIDVMVLIGASPSSPERRARTLHELVRDAVRVADERDPHVGDRGAATARPASAGGRTRRPCLSGSRTRRGCRRRRARRGRCRRGTARRSGVRGPPACPLHEPDLERFVGKSQTSRAPTLAACTAGGTEIAVRLRCTARSRASRRRGATRRGSRDRDAQVVHLVSSAPSGWVLDHVERHVPRIDHRAWSRVDRRRSVVDDRATHVDEAGQRHRRPTARRSPSALTPISNGSVDGSPTGVGSYQPWISIAGLVRGAASVVDEVADRAHVVVEPEDRRRSRTGRWCASPASSSARRRGSRPPPGRRRSSSRCAGTGAPVARSRSRSWIEV